MYFNILRTKNILGDKGIAIIFYLYPFIATCQIEASGVGFGIGNMKAHKYLGFAFPCWTTKREKEIYSKCFS